MTLSTLSPACLQSWPALCLFALSDYDKMTFWVSWRHLDAIPWRVPTWQLRVEEKGRDPNTDRCHTIEQKANPTLRGTNRRAARDACCLCSWNSMFWFLCFDKDADGDRVWGLENGPGCGAEGHFDALGGCQREAAAGPRVCSTTRLWRRGVSGCARPLSLQGFYGKFWKTCHLFSYLHFWKILLWGAEWEEAATTAPAEMFLW